MTPDDLFLGRCEAWLARFADPELSFVMRTGEHIVRAYVQRGSSHGTGCGLDVFTALDRAIAASPESDITPKRVSPGVARRFVGQILGWLDHHPDGEVNVSRVGDDRLVSFRSGTAAGTFFGQDGSLVRAVAEAAEVARLREHDN